MFSHLYGTALEQIIYLVDGEYLNIQDFEAFITSLKEAYSDTNYANTAIHTVNKLYQGNHDHIAYFIEFQCIVAALNWNDIAKHATLH
jgi:outer membrane protein assembly factor BamA